LDPLQRLHALRNLDAALAAALSELDPGRLYAPGSLWAGFAAGDGTFSDGPYVCHELEDIWRDDFYPHPFNPEVGATCVPVADSIRRMFPAAADAAPPAVLPDGGEAPNSAWALHCFQAHDGGADASVRNQLTRFGVPPPGDLDAYCMRSQLVGYEQTKALLEAWGSRMWRPYSGMLLWKAHNPWPGLRSALYDYWHDAGGGYGAALAVTRRGLHVQLNAATRRVEVVNTRVEPAPEATLSAVAVRLDGSVAWKAVASSPSVAGFSTVVCDLAVPPAPGDAEIVFLRIMLLPHESGAALARNVYLLSAPGNDFSALDAWRQTAASRVKLTLLKPPGADGEGGKVRVANVSPRVAFFVRLSLRSDKPPPPELPHKPLWRILLQILSRAFAPSSSGHVVVTLPQQPPPVVDDRVLPVFWSDTFITLLPGETLDVDFAHAPLPPGARTRLEASGWNVPLASVSV
jgi:mannosylglycoprotein endo-beta-mannosidase